MPTWPAPSIAPPGRSPRSEGRAMIELLAIPAHGTGPTTLEAWAGALRAGSGGEVTGERESAEGAWLVLGPLRLRGFAMIAGHEVEAINFELSAIDPAPATAMIEAVAAGL